MWKLQPGGRPVIAYRISASNVLAVVECRDSAYPGHHPAQILDPTSKSGEEALIATTSTGRAVVTSGRHGTLYVAQVELLMTDISYG